MRLQQAIDAKKIYTSGRITDEALVHAGVVRSSKHGVRLTGNEPLTVKIDIVVAAANSGAKAAVEKAGGIIHTTFTKRVNMNKKGEPGKKAASLQGSAEKRAAQAAS